MLSDDAKTVVSRILHCPTEMDELSFRSCASGELGLDCSNLGISTTNQASSSTPALADNSKNQGEYIKLNLMTKYIGGNLVRTLHTWEFFETEWHGSFEN